MISICESRSNVGITDRGDELSKREGLIVSTCRPHITPEFTPHHANVGTWPFKYSYVSFSVTVSLKIPNFNMQHEVSTFMSLLKLCYDSSHKLACLK